MVHGISTVLAATESDGRCMIHGTWTNDRCMVHRTSTAPVATESDGHCIVHGTFTNDRCMVHSTLTVPVATESDGASPQPPRPDEKEAGGSKSHEENTEADDVEDKENTGVGDMKDKTATVTGRDIDSTVVASEVQAVNADNQDPPPMMRKPETRQISQEQLVAEVKGIYASLVEVEAECIEVDNIRQSMLSNPIDITRFLEKIPYSKLIQLQQGSMNPHQTIRKWLQKALKVQPQMLFKPTIPEEEDVPEGDKKPSTPEATEDSPTTPKEGSPTDSEDDSPITPQEEDVPEGDKRPSTPEATVGSPTTPKEASAHPHVSKKAAQVPSLEECLYGFLMALKLRAKTDEWPEHEELAALTTAEIGEEGRKKGEYLLAVGREVVDQLVRDLEVAAAKAEKKKAEEEAARAKEAQRAAQAEADHPSSYPFVIRLTCTCMSKTPETQSGSSNAKQQAALEEAEEAFEDVGLEEAEVAAKAAPEEAPLEESAKQEAAQAEASHECLYPVPVIVTCTCVRETPDSPEALPGPSDAKQQAAHEETALEEKAPEEVEAALEETAPKEAEEAFKEVDLEEAEAAGKAAFKKTEVTLEAALEEKAEQEAARAEASHKCSYPILLMVPCTCVPDSPEALPRSSDAKQQAALEETAPEEAEEPFEEVGIEEAEEAAKAALEEMTFEKAEAAPEEATPKEVALEEMTLEKAEAGIAAENAGKDTAGATPQADGAGADGTVAQAKKRDKKQAKIPRLIEGRELDNPKLYKMVGIEYYMRFENRWIPSLNGEQWMALFALHRTYLHEQHDFFSASQHPSASPALRRLASKYAMPERMWRHGIHSFLEILRFQLPDCEETTWYFIHLSYLMLALLDETVPQFQLTWVECKADVARYG